MCHSFLDTFGVRLEKSNIDAFFGTDKKINTDKQLIFKLSGKPSKGTSCGSSSVHFCTELDMNNPLANKTFLPKLVAVLLFLPQAPPVAKQNAVALF